MRPGVNASAAGRSTCVARRCLFNIRISPAAFFPGRLVAGQREKVLKAEPEEINGEK